MVTRSNVDYEKHKEDIKSLMIDKVGDKKTNKFINHYKDRYDKHGRSFISYKLAYRLLDDYYYCKKIGTRWYAFVGIGGTGKSTLAKNVFYWLDESFTLSRTATDMREFIKIIGELGEEDVLKSAYLDEPDDSITSHSKEGKILRKIFGKIRQQKMFVGICATDLTDIPAYIYRKLDGIFFLPALGKGMFFKNRPRKKSYVLQEIRKKYQYKGYKVFYELQKSEGCLLFDTIKSTPLDHEDKEYLKAKRKDYEHDIEEFLVEKKEKLGELDNAIVNMRQLGLTHEQIAKNIGKNRSTVTKRLAKLGNVNA